MTDFMIALVVTVTLAPASPAVAVLVHTRPRTALPSTDSTAAHPAGPVSVPVVELAVSANVSRSPG